MKLQPASKKMSTMIAIGTTVGYLIMLASFWGLSLVETAVPFDYTVILGGAVGSVVAILNFVLMCLTIQTASQKEGEKKVKLWVQLSYNSRMLLQCAWVVLAAILPWFHLIASALPLLFPTMVIIVMRKNKKLIEPNRQDPQ